AWLALYQAWHAEVHLVNTAYAEPRIRTRIVVLPQRVAAGFIQADTVLARCSYRATATASDTTPEAVDGRSSPLGRGGPRLAYQIRMFCIRQHGVHYSQPRRVGVRRVPDTNDNVELTSYWALAGTPRGAGPGSREPGSRPRLAGPWSLCSSPATPGLRVGNDQEGSRTTARRAASTPSNKFTQSAANECGVVLRA